MEDTEIIELYFSRSEEAIRQSKIKYENYLRSIAYHILYSREDTEECLNDTWLSAWNTMPPLKPQVLSTYLGKLTRNHALDRYRRETAGKRGGKQTAVILEELSECLTGEKDPENDIIAHQELSDLLDRFLSSLSQQSRILFLQRYWYMLSVKEIAYQNRLSVSAVKMSLFRTREKLRELLITEGYEL